MNGNISRQEILNQVVEVIRKVIANPGVGDIRPETRLIDELGIDSLKIAEMSILLEDVFKQSFFLPSILSSVPDPYHLTVSSLVDFVNDSLRGSA